MKYILLVVLALASLSCDRGPKVIDTPVSESGVNTQSGNNNSTGIFDSNGGNTKPSVPTSKNSMGDVHTVTVKEILPTQKYVYMNVTEGSESYWIATGKQEVEVGEQYMFKGGLLKTNFESKEYDRVFDKVYLVSKVVPINHGQQETAKKVAKKTESNDGPSFKMEFDHGEEYVKIADLVDNPSKYAGKTIKMTGQCTKLNANIMGVNWIHLKDGTKDDYDMVLTSATAVPEGHIIKVEGTVAIDKDFGSGYRYAILLENAEMLNE